MSVQIRDSRWQVGALDFATRIIIPDLKGFFDSLPLVGGGVPSGRSLIIEPGTRSAIIEDGMLVGELYAGVYTLETFIERLKLWRKKQATVYLTRSEDVAVHFALKNLPCLEGVLMDMQAEWSLQMNNVILFVENLMGARESLSTSELTSLLAPILQQALRECVGQFSYDQLLSGSPSQFLYDGVISRVEVRLSRYGLTLTGLNSVTIAPQDGGISVRQGEPWLAQRENQLRRAAYQIDNAKVRDIAEDMRTKVELRANLREIVNEDRLNKIKSREDFEKEITIIDRDQLLRKEERESLINAYEERKEDHASLREHFLALIDLQREQELDELRLSIDHAVRMKSLQQEIEQARLIRTADSEQWQAELQREREEMEHRNDQLRRDRLAKWDRIRESQRQKREGSWEALLHEQRAEEIKADLEVSRADRKRQLAIVQAELENRLAQEKLEIQKRQELWEIEAREKKSTFQLDRLQRVQEMNAQFAEREQRLRHEIETLKEDGASKRELDRIQAMSGLGANVLIATAGAANAALLADLKKHEASQDAIKAQALANPAAELNAERFKMYEQMNATERAKAEAIAEAYKMAMQAQHNSVNQMIGGLAQASTPQAPFPSHYPHPLTMPAAPPMMPVTTPWYISLAGQQSPPLDWHQVQQYIRTGQLTSATMVWRQGMASWTPAGQVAELAPYLTSGPPSLPPAGNGPLGPSPL